MVKTFLAAIKQYFGMKLFHKEQADIRPANNKKGEKMVRIEVHTNGGTHVEILETDTDKITALRWLADLYEKRKNAELLATGRQPVRRGAEAGD
jgi:hydroxymethylpyrimidine pyrophosphatase-like HAD family hydrolase